MFNLGFDKRTLYIFLGIMLLINLMTGGMNLATLVYSLPGVIIAMTFHEFAHAWMATKLGDDMFNISWIWMGKTSRNQFKEF